jgi:flagellar hook-length control protein FliK
MTIETVPVKSSAHSVSGRDSLATKGKSQGGGSPDAGITNGFLSLLMQIDTQGMVPGDLEQDAQATLANSGEEDRGGLIDVTGGILLPISHEPTKQVSIGVLNVAVSDSAAQPLVPDADPSAVLALTMHYAGDSVPRTVSSDAATLPVSNDAKNSLFANTRAETTIAAPNSLPLGKTQQPLHEVVAMPDVVTNGMSFKQSTNGAGSVEGAPNTKASATHALANRPGDAPINRTNIDQRLHETLHPLDHLMNAASLTTEVAVLTNTVESVKREFGVQDRQIVRAVEGGGSYAPSAWSDSAGAISAPTQVQEVAPFDTYLTEQVSYWISNDIQNAELKLDGFGETPVEVSIRMVGNEAYIAFRSDESQTRMMLEDAAQHLKEALQKDGVVLSNVSVGTSDSGGAGGSGAQDRKPRNGTLQVGGVGISAEDGDRRPSITTASTGALDLFV